jgi:hypothetical protein
MPPKTRFADSPHVSPLDSTDLCSQHSSVVPTPDTLALVLEQLALINARMDAQSADAADVGAAAAAFAAIVDADPHVAQRRRDAQLEYPRDGPSVDSLPSPPPHSLLGYALHTQGPLFPDARPHQAPTSRGHPHLDSPPPTMPGHSPFVGGPPRRFYGQHSSTSARGALGSRGGRRPTIDHVVVGRAAH